MNYELAEELMKAGFPQTDGEYIGSKGKECLIPKLGQLIDACGEDFNLLEHQKGGIIHLREKYQNVRPEEWHTSSWSREESFGFSPEEAVAKLWISLNKK